MSERRTKKQRRRSTLKVILIAAACGAVAGAGFWTFRHFHKDRRFEYNEDGKIIAIRALEKEQNAPLGFSDEGDDVAQIQKRLAAFGYYDGEATGFYGTQTVAAVRLFQTANGLGVTGVSDAATQAKLEEARPVMFSVYDQIVQAETDAQEAGTSLVTALNSLPKEAVQMVQVEVWDETAMDYVERAESVTYEEVSDPDAPHGDPDNLRIGDVHERVAEIQQKLKEYGYYAGATVNNYYGTMTQTAVFNFQKANGITPDGIAGSATQARLFDETPVNFNDYLAAGGLEYSPRDELVADILNYAKQYQGVPYVYGGASPSGFDCSGFTMYVYRHFGYYFAHGATAQSNRLGAELSSSQLLPGDLVFFDTNGGHDSIEHVGIYIGNGEFIHASSGSGRVIINSLYSGYYSGTFLWGKRVIPA